MGYGAKTAQAIRNVWARVGVQDLRNRDYGDRLQIEPAGATAGKSFAGSSALLKRLRQEYMATSATISMTLASV